MQISVEFKHPKKVTNNYSELFNEGAANVISSQAIQESSNSSSLIKESTSIHRSSSQGGISYQPPATKSYYGDDDDSGYSNMRHASYYVPNQDTTVYQEPVILSGHSATQSSSSENLKHDNDFYMAFENNAVNNQLRRNSEQIRINEEEAVDMYLNSSAYEDDEPDFVGEAARAFKPRSFSVPDRAAPHRRSSESYSNIPDNIMSNQVYAKNYDLIRSNASDFYNQEMTSNKQNSHDHKESAQYQQTFGGSSSNRTYSSSHSSSERSEKRESRRSRTKTNTGKINAFVNVVPPPLPLNQPVQTANIHFQRQPLPITSYYSQQNLAAVPVYPQHHHYQHQLQLQQQQQQNYNHHQYHQYQQQVANMHPLYYTNPNNYYANYYNNYYNNSRNYQQQQSSSYNYNNHHSASVAAASANNQYYYSSNANQFSNQNYQYSNFYRYN